MEINKKVSLKLVGLDGNAFSLMGAFKRQAQKEKWSQKEVQSVLDECMSGDYDHLLATLAEHCTDPSLERDRNDEEDGKEDYEIMIVVKKNGEIKSEESLTCVYDLGEAEELLYNIVNNIRERYGY